MKNLTKDYFEELDFLPKLLKYFALSPENRVTVPGVFDNVKITFYQDDDGGYHKIVDNGDGEFVKLDKDSYVAEKITDFIKNCINGQDSCYWDWNEPNRHLEVIEE